MSGCLGGSDSQREANTELRNRGASPKKRQALLGHMTAAIREAQYKALLPSRRGVRAPVCQPFARSTPTCPASSQSAV